MLLQLLFVTVLLYEATDAGKTSNQKVSFNVEKIFLSYSKKGKICYCEEKYVERVQEYYTGCRKATWLFRGPSYCFADNIIISMERHISKLLYFSNTNSTVLASSTTKLFETISKCNRLGKSGLVIIREFNKVLPRLVKNFNWVVEEKLSKYIGDVAKCFVNTLVDLSDELSNFLETFLHCSGAECKRKVDYKPVCKKFQVFLNTFALIAETILNDCDTPTREHFETMTILSLIFGYFSMAVQGMNSCVQDNLYGEEHHVSKDIETISPSLDFVAVEANQAISEIVYPFNDKIKQVLVTFVDITLAFNKATNDILGGCDGAAITRGEIIKNLRKCCKSPSAKLLKDRTNIVKGILAK